MKNSRDLILGEVVYIAIIYHITDSCFFLLNGYNFYLDHMTDENQELIAQQPRFEKFSLTDCKLDPS